MADLVFKVVIIGEPRVGKTSIRRNYMGQGFSKSILATLGADFASDNVKLNIDGKEFSCQLQIWDIAGQETFKSVRSRFFLKSNGIIAVFDLTNPQTFNMVPKWLQEVWKTTQTKSLPIMLLGNKDDLTDDRKVSFEQGIEFAKMIRSRYSDVPFVEYVETSALTGHNIKYGFKNLVKALYDQMNTK